MAGGSWHNPPSEESILDLQHEPQITDRIEKLLRAKFSNKLYTGWKDPRTTLTIKLFLPYLENPHFIACFRDPNEVAKSLALVHYSLNTQQCLKIAKLYNQRLLKFLAEFTGI